MLSAMTEAAAWDPGRLQKETKLKQLIVATSKAMIRKQVFSFSVHF